MSELADAEKALYELSLKVAELRKAAPLVKVSNYGFETETGNTNLRDLFGDKEHLIVIHNMGQACRYCTLWGDGLNGFVSHLENACGLVMVSKDDPLTQRNFANARGWRFKMVSHGGGPYIVEQSVMENSTNCPGVVAYRREEDDIYRMNSGPFGPGDEFCSMWNLLNLAGLGEAQWTPQYNYWRRPEVMEDGGENLPD